MTTRRTKHLGQHMLMDQKALDYEVAMLGPEGKVVLEIGGGTGNLSVKLAEKAKKLIIVEKDELMVYRLNDLFEDNRRKNVTVIHADFLELIEKDILKAAGTGKKSDADSIDLIISNVPYVISSPLLFKLSEFNFEKAVLCLQKEFVQRMTAKAGDRDWSRLSVMTHLYFKPVHLREVKRGSFRPMPEVDSAIVMLTKTGEQKDERRDKFIEHLFSHRKNTLRAALKAKEMAAEYPGAIDASDKLGLLERRVFTLSIDELKELSSLL